MRSEPLWLTAAEVIEANRIIVQETGEPFLLRDQNLLQSAVDRPQNHWHYDGEDDVVSLAVTLIAGLARNHPFQQGNKRTAFAVGLLFLANNGYAFRTRDDPTWARLLIALVERRLPEAAFEAAFARAVAPI